MMLVAAICWWHFMYKIGHQHPKIVTNIDVALNTWRIIKHHLEFRIKHLWLSQLNNCLYVRNHVRQFGITEIELKLIVVFWNPSLESMKWFQLWYECDLFNFFEFYKQHRPHKTGPNSHESDCISMSIPNREEIIWPSWPWTWRLNEHLDRTFAWWFQR